VEGSKFNSVSSALKEQDYRIRLKRASNSSSYCICMTPLTLCLVSFVKVVNLSNFSEKNMKALQITIEELIVIINIVLVNENWDTMQQT
jgi:hypothetical protein